MKKLFTLAAVICGIVACQPKQKVAVSVEPIDIQPSEFTVADVADSLRTSTAEITLPAQWKDLDGYDKVLVNLGTIDFPTEVYVNGEFVSKRGFFPELEGYSQRLNKYIGRNASTVYLPIDSDFLAWGEANKIEIKHMAGKSFDSPVRVVPVKASLPENQAPSLIFNQMMHKFRIGWNSWDTRSDFTQIYTPEGYGIKVALVDDKGEVCEDLRIGNQDEDAAILRPYDHTYDGTYSEIDATWHGVAVKLRCAAKGDELVMLLTPKEDNVSGKLRIKAGPAWDYISNVSDGEIYSYEKGNRFMYERYDCTIALDGHVDAADVKAEEGTYTCPSNAPVLITVGKRYTLDEAEKLLEDKKNAFEAADREKYGDKYEVYHSMQSILAWDTVYDPGDEVVVTPVSRNWDLRFGAVKDFGGYVLFDWDTFFASQMLSTGCKELAYSNSISVLSSVDKIGFVPKDRCDHNSYTEDASQPPVGSMTVWTIYNRFHDRWYLELAYDRLAAWNRWWPQARQTDGLLCWGSNPVRIRGGERGSGQANNARLESGLDNSQMWDDVPYNPETYQLELADVGLTSMYVMDCDYLAKIAKELGHDADAKEFAQRGDTYRKNIQRFWCEEDGMFYNINTATGEFNKVTSPTNFYVLLANAATKEQADRLIKEHLLNEEEYWGEYVIPNASKKDPAFQEQNYWRGRIWGPTNFLVYSGLRNYPDAEVMHAFAQKSENLIMLGWMDNGYIYENWNANTGEGMDVSSSDRFYHWGALMSYISLIDSGYFK